MLGPAGAPCAPAVPWAHPWAGAQHHGAPRRAHVAAEARSHKVPRFAGRAQRNPQTTPLNACWRVAHSATRPRHLRRRPVGLRAGLPLAQSAAKCKGKPRRWRGGIAALAFCGRRCPIAAPGAQALSGSAPAAARGLSLPPLGGARPPGPVSGLGRAARPGLNNGPYSGLCPSAALARTRARLAGAIAASDGPAVAG